MIVCYLNDCAVLGHLLVHFSDWCVVKIRVTSLIALNIEYILCPEIWWLYWEDIKHSLFTEKWCVGWHHQKQIDIYFHTVNCCWRDSLGMVGGLKPKNLATVQVKNRFGHSCWQSQHWYSGGTKQHLLFHCSLVEALTQKPCSIL